ncbi:Carbon-nitrogen hydrolase [Penicillium capsulatum]|uniref:Carbon-nitrogen hydrolase n=1 Tax=Penicillium capsulatum TaxID=69766 RepID=A0A9W9IRT4_9EURO|nr:Carbon-nitrogen hydrolase [Penicillium capsulatum]KAJ6130458.1 Carbon-nitrogen hydrolase [Penicillium capsulatum]
MRIATLQFAPKLGDLDGNIRRANDLLQHEKVLSSDGKTRLALGLLRPELLVLPEMALTGYNFPSLDAVKPYLEPVGTGPSAAWARDTAKRLHCKVCVGYPEIEANGDGPLPAKYYNSLVVVDEHGQVLHNYRKSFLYYTDDTWASEGNMERGFHELSFRDANPSTHPSDLGGDIPRYVDAKASASDALEEATANEKRVATSFGICMDINPYKFQAPWTKWEFANQVLDTRSQLVILSMAWLTHMSREELNELDGQPEMDTFNYWLQRFWPLLEKRMQHEGGDPDGPKQVVIVFSNRAGEEPAADDDKPPVQYAGTSAVVAVTQRPRLKGSQEELEVKILCWDLLGAVEEGICFADTSADPKLVFGLKTR